MKYEYAIENSELIHISSINNQNRKNYSDLICISCGNALIPKLGECKIHHFAHKINCECSSETYLHRLAKTTLFNNLSYRLQNNLPYYVSIPFELACNHYSKYSQFCQRSKKNYPINILKFFDSVYLERACDSFVPDVLLFNKKTELCIFIEIAVSHFCSEQKIKSNNRIIEIPVFNQSDIKGLSSSSLDDIDTYTYNFIVKSAYDELCNNYCIYKKERDEKFYSHMAEYFVIHTSGKCQIVNLSNRQFIANSKNNMYRFAICRYGDYKDINSVYFKDSIFYLYAEQNFNIRNCQLCKHNHRSSYESYCYYYNRITNSNDAIKCKAYAPIKKEIARKYID